MVTIGCDRDLPKIVDLTCKVVEVIDSESDADSDVVLVEVEEAPSPKRSWTLDHNFMEFYSPPRIVPECTAFGCNAKLSFDLTSAPT